MQARPGLCSILWVCLVGCISCIGPHKILFGWLHCSLGCTVVARLGPKVGQLEPVQPAQPETSLICISHYAGRIGLFAQPEPG
jgi:hypothetical protein